MTYDFQGTLFECVFYTFSFGSCKVTCFLKDAKVAHDIQETRKYKEDALTIDVPSHKGRKIRLYSLSAIGVNINIGDQQWRYQQQYQTVILWRPRALIISCVEQSAKFWP